MVTIANHPLPAYYGLAADANSLPTAGVPNGAMFTEIDTGKQHCFDEENGEWKEWGASDGT